jgi:glucose uptake protein GlcU
MTLTIISWIAVVVLSASFWFQIWKIHVHREVRDLSIIYYALLVIGYGILSYTAYTQSSWIFLVKQVATLVPSAIIICQIIYHREDRWHEAGQPLCHKCNDELDPGWGFCPACGQSTESF